MNMTSLRFFLTENFSVSGDILFRVSSYSNLIMIAYTGGEPFAVIKIPKTPAQGNRILQVATRTAELRDLAQIRPYLPEKTLTWSLNGKNVLVESFCPGRPPGNDSACRQIRPDIFEFQAALLQTFSSRKQPRQALADAINNLEVSGATMDAKQLLLEQAYRVEASRLLTGVPHGDFTPNNLLVKRGSLVSVIDWEYGKPDECFFFDLFSFLISSCITPADRRLADSKQDLLKAGYLRLQQELLHGSGGLADQVTAFCRRTNDDEIDLTFMLNYSICRMHNRIVPYIS